MSFWNKSSEKTTSPVLKKDSVLKDASKDKSGVFLTRFKKDFEDWLKFKKIKRKSVLKERLFNKTFNLTLSKALGPDNPEELWFKERKLKNNVGLWQVSPTKKKQSLTKKRFCSKSFLILDSISY